MKTYALLNKLLTITLAIVCAILILQYREISALNRTLSASRGQPAAQETKSVPPGGSVERRAVSSPLATAVGESPSGASRTPSTARLMAPRDQKSKLARQISNVRLKLEWDRHSDVCQLVNSYIFLLKPLNLSPEQETKLSDLIMERNYSVHDAQELARKQTVRGSLTAGAMSRAQVEIENEIANSVGPGALAAVKKIDSLTLDLGRVRAEYSPEMAFNGVPLSSEQTLNFAGLIRELERKKDDTSEQVVDPQTYLSMVDRDALDRAATFLSPPQVALLESHLAYLNRSHQVIR